MPARKSHSPSRTSAEAKRVVGGSAALRTGSPPLGTIGEDAIERLVAQWLRNPKKPADHARLPHVPLLKQGQLLAEGREDLPAFIGARTPINSRAFDYLDVLLRMTEAQQAPAEKRYRPRAPTAESKAAMKQVVETLRVVLYRAEACGRTLRLYELSCQPWSHAGFITQLLHVVQAGRRRLEKWDDPAFAETLFASLESAALRLEEAWKLEPTTAPADKDEARRMALHQLLYDAISYLGAYGRAIYATDPDAAERYSLGILFPPGRKTGLTPPMKLITK